MIGSSPKKQLLLLYYTFPGQKSEQKPRRTRSLLKDTVRRQKSKGRLCPKPSRPKAMTQHCSSKPPIPRRPMGEFYFLDSFP